MSIQMTALKASLLALLVFLTAGCDFTSGLHKDILKAQERITNQDFGKAAEIYEEILVRKPSKTIQIKINYQLAEIYSIYLNDHEKALRHLRAIIETSNEPSWQVKALERIGSIHFEEFKNYKKAKKAYQSLMNFVPKLEKQDEYAFKFAQCEFHLENFEESEKRFEQLAANPDFGAEAYYYMGLGRFYRNDWDGAVNQWFEYLKREKRKDKIVQIKFLIANAYESSERLKEAYNIYYSIIGEYPNPEVIESRLNSLYERRVARKR